VPIPAPWHVGLTANLNSSGPKYLTCPSFCTLSVPRNSAQGTRRPAGFDAFPFPSPFTRFPII
jgi:hypothetical protein